MLESRNIEFVGTWGWGRRPELDPRRRRAAGLLAHGHALVAPQPREHGEGQARSVASRARLLELLIRSSSGTISLLFNIPPQNSIELFVTSIFLDSSGCSLVYLTSCELEDHVLHVSCRG